MTEAEKLDNLILRLERMRGKVLEDGTKVTYLGDGINPGVTSKEILDFLRQLKNNMGNQ